MAVWWVERHVAQSYIVSSNGTANRQYTVPVNWYSYYVIRIN